MKEDFNKLPKSPKEAKAVGSPHYFTGKPCKRGHVWKRSSSDNSCLACKKVHRDANKDKRKVSAQKYYLKNKERINENNKSWYWSNWDYRRATIRKYEQENKESLKEYRATWREENKDLVRKYDSERRAREIQRSLNLPKHLQELNDICIGEMFAQAKDMESITKEEYHVDHIVPLKGDTVSGLNIWYNLQVISKSENLSKGNKLLPEFSYEQF